MRKKSIPLDHLMHKKTDGANDVDWNWKENHQNSSRKKNRNGSPFSSCLKSNLISKFLLDYYLLCTSVTSWFCPRGQVHFFSLDDRKFIWLHEIRSFDFDVLLRITKTKTNHFSHGNMARPLCQFEFDQNIELQDIFYLRLSAISIENKKITTSCKKYPRGNCLHFRIQSVNMTFKADEIIWLVDRIDQWKFVVSLENSWRISAEMKFFIKFKK